MRYFSWEIDCIFVFLRAVVNIPIQTLIISIWLLFRKKDHLTAGAWATCGFKSPSKLATREGTDWERSLTRYHTTTSWRTDCLFHSVRHLFLHPLLHLFSSTQFLPSWFRFFPIHLPADLPTYLFSCLPSWLITYSEYKSSNFTILLIIRQVPPNPNYWTEELASELWDSYQDTQDIYVYCSGHNSIPLSMSISW